MPLPDFLFVFYMFRAESLENDRKIYNFITYP